MATEDESAHLIFSEEQAQDLYDKQKKTLIEADAEVIYRACKGWGHNDTALINTICSRTKAELHEIDMHYRETYNKTLVELIESECKGDYKRFLVACVQPKATFDAYLLRKATKGMGCNEKVLIELILARQPDEVLAMKEKYEASGKSIIDLLKKELKGELENLLIQCVRRPIEMGTVGAISEDDAKAKAEELKKAAKGFGCDKKVFTNVLGTATRADVQEICVQYEKLYESSLRRLIEKEFGGDLESAMKSLLYDHPHKYLCYRINKAMKGLGCDEDPIVRILGGVDKSEARQIAKTYFKLYDVRLKDDLRKELKGKLRRAVLAWLDLEDPLEVSSGKEHNLQSSVGRLAMAIAERDADKIYMACRGWGCNEDAVIDVMCRRNKDQIARIDKVFREKYNRSLVRQLGREMRGDLRKVMKYVAMSQTQYDVYMLKRACDGLGTDETLLITIICLANNQRLHAMKQHFKEKEGKSLVDRVRSEISGSFLKLMLNLLKCDRDESGVIDEERAAEQAAEIHEAGPERWGTNDDKFIDIICNSSVAQIGAIRKAYESTYDQSLEKCIKKEFSGDMERALLCLCQDPVDYKCERLMKAFKGWGTDETTVCRILGGLDKDESDVVAQRYLEKYGDRLQDALRKEISGDFLTACVGWITYPEFTEGLEGNYVGIEEEEDLVSDDEDGMDEVAPSRVPDAEEEEEEDDDEDDDILDAEIEEKRSMIDPAYRSLNADVGKDVVFNNKFGDELEVNWLDYDGDEIPMGTVAAGESYSTSTFATHPWRFRSAVTHKIVFSWTASLSEAADSLTVDVMSPEPPAGRPPIIATKSTEAHLYANRPVEQTPQGWPAMRYISIEVTDAVLPLGSVEVTCNAADQGWGGEGSAYLEVCLFPARGNIPKAQERVATVGHNFQTFQDVVELPSQVCELAEVGDKLALRMVCPPWQGWAIRVTSATLVAKSVNGADAPEALGSDTKRNIHVIVPQFARPGQQILATTPDGLQLSIIVPRGVAPGQKINVEY